MAAAILSWPSLYIRISSVDRRKSVCICGSIKENGGFDWIRSKNGQADLVGLLLYKGQKSFTFRLFGNS